MKEKDKELFLNKIPITIVPANQLPAGCDALIIGIDYSKINKDYSQHNGEFKEEDEWK